MKKILILFLTFTLFIGVLNSCRDNDGIQEQENSIDAKTKLEIFRKEFATRFSETVVESREVVKYITLPKSNGSLATLESSDSSFDEFLANVPNGNMLGVTGKKLAKESFDLALSGQSTEDIISNFGTEQVIELVNEMAKLEQSLSVDEAVDKIMFGDDKFFIEESSYKGIRTNGGDCRFFCKVWNGVKSAVAWLWEHRKEILDFIRDIRSL
ncbi:hypothetical protein [Riemerella anatipestifer]|uniref:hypothetical protein n=1 Tax=Riemerella anatipestifer TaxID=34085 RepID=UPI0007EDFDC0|nr:hypothetical protein [Riemerella anatipestifer]AZZ57893.1 hypothetical protein AWB57_01895 [Riemerella anatipestifer]MCW0510462.1 hypothetical protein [Riemerella anatipestifer]MCW0518983.1 hypothetical protein [Riemerella anatipestifer]MDR7693790.1 hypothetical protein [Riemerella anatipestifer]MDR7794315.1 hypothetical protein [Riemerella anatipestifer]